MSTPPPARAQPDRRSVLKSCLVLPALTATAAGCSVTAKKSPPPLHGHVHTSSEAVAAIKSVLIKVMQHTPKQFPQVRWVPKIELDINQSGLDEPADIELQITAHGAATNHWRPFIESIVDVVGPEGITPPDEILEGGRAKTSYLRGNGGVLMEVTAEVDTVVSLMVPHTRFDDRSLQNGVIWRDGHNVYEPVA